MLSSMSDKFDSLDAFEKAAVEATLAVQIESELRKRPKHFVDKLSLFYASLEHAADIILEQKRR